MNGRNANHTAKPELKLGTGLINTLLLTGLLSLGACGGGADTERLPPDSGDKNKTAVDLYDGPTEENDQVRAFLLTVYKDLRLTDRCGACHSSTTNNQDPRFVQRDDVNEAYRIAMGLAGGPALINTSDPASSRLVTKVLSGAGPQGHNCWLETKEACAFYITNRIQNMVAVESGNSSREIPLTAPTDHEIEVVRTWPEDAPAQFATLHNILRTNCATCHVPGSAIQGSPMFAVDDAELAYDELRINGKVVLGDTVESRAQSRIVVRPRDENHVCWDTDNDGDLDCPESAQAILDAIGVLVSGIPDPTAGNNQLTNLVTSKALTMADAILASGGNRYEANQIVLYEFKTGAGRDIVDVSTMSPGVNLRLFGQEGVDYQWLGNFGIEFMGPNGMAIADPATVRKLYDAIVDGSGSYSIEAWVIPNNVVQENAAIITYGSSSENRNFGLEQDMYNYTYYNRLTVGDTVDASGLPFLRTPDDPESVQTALQHVVTTYSSAGKRRIYVNGRLDSETDTAPDGSLVNWDLDYQLILGNSDAGDRPWRGALRMVAIHNSELTPEQVRQNFDVGVGEKFYMLFPLRQKDTNTSDADTTEPQLAGIPPSCHVKLEFMEYDAFSYLFTDPQLICLDPTETPAGIAVKSMWLGINGGFPNAGQAYQTIDVNGSDPRTTPVAVDPATNSVTLSNIGTTIELQNGPLGTGTLPPDQFFLAFDVIGGENTVDQYLPDPAASLPAPETPADPAPSSDIGIRTFDEINESMSKMTGVAATNSAIQNVFNQYIQQLPSSEDIEAFLPSHQMAVTQLALQYCNQMVIADTGTGNASNGLFTGTFNDYDQTLSTEALRNEVADRFMQMFMNYDTTATPSSLATQPDVADVRSYLVNSGNVTLSDDRGFTSVPFTSLMETLVSRGTSTADTVTATCGAILGSAVTLVQ